MDPDRPDPVNQRLTDLEIKASFTEDLLEQLNQVVIRQQTQIDLLRRELVTLREFSRPDDPASPRSLRDELPPHY
ncbi:MAG: SlyX family protein [Aquabacterium sp.]